MKKLLFLVVIALVLSVVPAFAQDSFKDLPEDHWAYDAVVKLQAAGLVQGYPGNLYMGKRNLTRYEFAKVVAAVYEKIEALSNTAPQVTGETGSHAGFLKKADVDNILANYVAKSDGVATKADIDAAMANLSADLKKLGSEFRKELDSLGVRVSDLDAKVNDLAATVAAVKAEQERVVINGTFNTVAKVASNSGSNGIIVDRDNRTANGNDNAIRSVGVFNDFDLSIKGKISENTKFTALLNMGNYLNYLGTTDAYNYGTIARGTNGVTGFGDSVFPYYLYLDTKTGFGDLTFGRLPVQLSPYTLKKIDVDTYVSNAKTDDGNYSIDGVKLKSSYGSVDVLAFAGKTDNNTFQTNLSTIFPTGGTLDNTVTEVSNLNIAQIAGVQVGVGLPMDSKLGLTYTRSWSEQSWTNGQRNQPEVMAADLTIPLPWIEGAAISATAGQSNILSEVTGVSKLDWRNGIYDAKLTSPVGPVNLGVGYKRIGENYVAPGDWGKIGRWQNPRMIKGLYATLAYPILDNLNLNLGGQFYKFTDSKLGLVKDDKTNVYTGGLEWKLSDANALGVDVEWVTYSWSRPAGYSVDDPTEKYITLGWNHKLNDDAALKIGYQLISYDRGSAANVPAVVPYANDYSGGLGVVQLGVSF